MNALFDTPEEIAVELERCNIDEVDHIFYSHWHPDLGISFAYDGLTVQV